MLKAGKAKNLVLACAILFTFGLMSCGDDNPAAIQQQDVLLYEDQGIVDSAVVTGCYAYTLRHFLQDTLDLSAYSRIRVEFDGYSTSDHSTISVLSNSHSSTNDVLYSASNENVNKPHSFESGFNSDTLWLELRLYLNPQVCGENEFKYTRARDLRIYGVK
ncbi:MAG: hypothetical protein JNK43_07005 [Ignavibacteria bacterium]|nr:hypothetical protein [Ignavibacteria bacterium]